MKRPIPRNVPLPLIIAVACLAVMSPGCSRIIGHYTKPLFDDLTSSFMRQRDVVLAEQGASSFLLILDGLITRSPDNPTLLLAGAKAYSSYNTAFVGSRDPERNKILALKAKDYALRALSLHSRKFAQVKDKNYDEFIVCLLSFKKKDVPFLFYAATCWAGWVTANNTSWDAIAEIPRIEAIILRVIELDEGYYYGTPNAFMGVLLTIRSPSMGGKPEEARQYFQKAVKLGEGKFLPTYIMYARSYAQLVYDKKLFFELLNKVLESSVDKEPDLVLVNTLARRQAADLVAEARREEYFD